MLDAYRPALVPVAENVTAAAFPLMKIFPAEFCVRRAIQDGAVTKGSLIVETSSGTMGLGLAIVCNWYGYALTIVTDYACDQVLKSRIEDLGAKVEIVSGPAACGGYQGARLKRVNEIRRGTGDSWWLNQYDNPGNAAGYGSFAAQLLDSIGRIDCLIGTVGSGGSVCGTSKFLRAIFPEMQVAGVDTFGSVLFGQPDGPRELRGLGNSLFPQNLDYSAFDEVHWVSAAAAYTATRILHRETSLYRGATSGAAWLVARYWAQRNPGARVVCIFPDDGQRYALTVYNDRHLGENNLWLDPLPAAPVRAGSPRDAGPHWSWFPWKRRSLAEVLGREIPVLV
jgi:cysteine synthase A